MSEQEWELYNIKATLHVVALLPKGLSEEEAVKEAEEAIEMARDYGDLDDPLIVAHKAMYQTLPPGYPSPQGLVYGAGNEQITVAEAWEMCGTPTFNEHLKGQVRRANTLLAPPHPGICLLRYLDDDSFSVGENKVKEKLGWTDKDLADVLNGKRGITKDEGVELAALFGNCSDSWNTLQSGYDIYQRSLKDV